MVILAFYAKEYGKQVLLMSFVFPASIIANLSYGVNASDESPMAMARHFLIIY